VISENVSKYVFDQNSGEPAWSRVALGGSK
jgi:hypothetical protein